MRPLLTRLTRRDRLGCWDPRGHRNDLETLKTASWTQAETLEDLTAAVPALVAPMHSHHRSASKASRIAWRSANFFCLFQSLWRRVFLGNLGPFSLGRHTTINQHPPASDNPWNRAEGKPLKRDSHIRGQGGWRMVPYTMQTQGKWCWMGGDCLVFECTRQAVSCLRDCCPWGWRNILPALSIHLPQF